MGGNLGMILRAFALLALIYLAWSQTKARREQQRAEREQAVAAGCHVLRGDRGACGQGSQQLLDYGIRSWLIKDGDCWSLVVDASNRQDAIHALGRRGDAA